MQHQPTAEQTALASEKGEVVQLENKNLLMVPDDTSLGHEWFSTRAEEIIAAIGGVTKDDILHVMGQQQLAMAVSAIGRRAGAQLVESVTPRISKEVVQADNTVKKENVFSFAGFRVVHQY